MNRGFYYACNGMIMNQRKLDCIGNNLTNMSTPGYKRDTIITNRFQEQMILVKHREELSGTFAQTLSTLRTPTSGRLLSSTPGLRSMLR